MRKRFRHFIKESQSRRIRQAELDPTYLEMAMGDVHVNEDLPLMPHLIAAMNAVTYAQKVESQMARLAKTKFMEWAHTEGLRQALIGRREIAKIASQELGVEVPQWAVFAPAEQREKIVGEDGMTTYNDIYPEIEKLYFEKYEPKSADISTPARSAFVPLGAINHLISTHSKNGDTFRFGGENGLIEYIERGDWKKHGRHWDVESGRHGFDLHLPEGSSGIKRDQQNGQHYYSFGGPHPDQRGENTEGGFNPPRNESGWREAFRRAMGRSASAMAKMAADGEDIGNWVQEKLASGELTRQQIQHSGVADYLGHTQGMSNKFHSAEGITFETPEDMEKFKEYARAYFRNKYDQPRKGSGGGFRKDGRFHAFIPGWPSKDAPYVFDAGKSPEEDIEAIIDYLFDDQEGTMRASMYKKFQDQDKNSKERIPSFNILKQGASLLRQEVGDEAFDADYATPRTSDVFRQAADVLDIGEFDAAQEEIKEDDLLSSGYQPLDLTDQEQESGSLDPQRSKLRLVLPGTGRVIIARRIKGKKWSIDTAPEEEPMGDEWEVTPGMGGKSGTAHRGPEQAPVRRSGDKWVRASSAHSVEDPHQIVPGHASFKVNAAGVTGARPLSAEKSRAIQDDWFGNPENYGDRIVRSKDGPMPASILGIDRSGKSGNVRDPGAAMAKLLAHVGNPNFKYGDPNKLGNLLADEGGLGPEEVQIVLNGFQNSLNNGMEPDQHDGDEIYLEPNKFRSDVYELMLANGYDWRSNVARSMARTAEKEDQGGYTHELDFGADKDTEGGGGGIQVTSGGDSAGKGTAGGKKHVEMRPLDVSGGRASKHRAVDVAPELVTGKQRAQAWLADKKGLPTQRSQASEPAYQDGYDGTVAQLQDEGSLARKVYAIKKSATAARSEDPAKALGVLDAGTDWAKRIYVDARSKKTDLDVVSAELMNLQGAVDLEAEVAAELGEEPKMFRTLSSIGLELEAPKVQAVATKQKPEAPQDVQPSAKVASGYDDSEMFGGSIPAQAPQQKKSSALMDRMKTRRVQAQPMQARPMKPRPVAQPYTPPEESKDFDDDDMFDWNTSLMSFADYLTQLQEIGGATSVVFDPKVKAKDGCGFNYEGAPGAVNTSITGDVETVNSDPDGTKEMNGRKGKGRSKGRGKGRK